MVTGAKPVDSANSFRDFFAFSTTFINMMISEISIIIINNLLIINNA